MRKLGRQISWNDLEQWEHLLVPNARVIWRGANACLYPATVLAYCNGNMRLKFEDGHESEPCYIEQIVQVETEEEIINLKKN